MNRYAHSPYPNIVYVAKDYDEYRQLQYEYEEECFMTCMLICISLFVAFGVYSYFSNK